MTNSWKMTVAASKDEVETALLAQEATLDWDADVVVSGCEIAEDRPNDWLFEAWLDHKPNAKDKAAVAQLFAGRSPELTIEKLPDADWVTVSQQGVEPIFAGAFHVRTPDHPPSTDHEWVDLVIPASQAFGTGQHETTAGCLAMLTAMRRRGVYARDIADIGTGTGLLAFGARALWPSAKIIASDIDPVCEGVVRSNAARNAIRIGDGRRDVALTIADGMDAPVLAQRAPFDVLIANILAAPLIELAPDFARSVVPGGHVVLAGLLITQEHAVRAAYRKAGFRIAARLENGDWSILWLRKRG